MCYIFDCINTPIIDSHKTAMKSLSLSIFMVLFLTRLTMAGGYEPTFKNSTELIRRANELHDSGYYQPAISLLHKVVKTDPNYTWSVYELALNYFYLEHYQQSYRLCKEAEFLKYNNPFLYSLMGSCLDHLGKTVEGIGIIKNALKKWPYNQNLIYNLGVCYLNAAMPDSAEKAISKAIILYPYHTHSHLVLARANYAMGHIAESYLAFCMAILISPNINNIKEFEKAISGDLEIVPRLYQYPYPAGMPHKKWDDMRYLLQSEISFNKAFPYPFEVDFTFTRQSYLLFTGMHYDSADTSLYNRLYIHLFSEMAGNGYFDTYSHYCMKNLGNDASETWNKNNPGRINNFIQWAQAFIDKGRTYAFRDDLQQKETIIHHFDDAGNLTTIGEESENGQIKNGDFILVDKDGRASEKGKYVNNLTEGSWLVFWPDGKIKQDMEFEHDQLNGTLTTYYPNGAKWWNYAFSAGKKNGSVEQYTASGNLIEKDIYEQDHLNGPGTYVAYKEAFSRTYQYRNDSLYGETHEIWLNGTPKATYEMNNNQNHGKYLSWYAQGKPESVCFYTHDVKTGPWINYYFTGGVKDSGRYDSEGKLTGKYWSYDEQGRLLSCEGDYRGGLLTGTAVTYFENGKEQVIQYYRNDTLIKTEAFSDNGKLMYSAENTGDSLYYKLFYADGMLFKEGLLKNGKCKGPWVTYNPLGTEITRFQYRDNMLWGLQQTYYASGALHEEYQCDSNNINGMYKAYYKDGHMQTLGNYEDGEYQGAWTWFGRNDSISSTAFYLDGKSVGRLISYSPDGSLSSEEFFDGEGKSVRLIDYDQNRKIVTDWEYGYGSFEFKSKYPNGAIKSVVHISDNDRDGLQQSYYPNGQLISQINYQHGKINGPVLTYDYHGNLENSCQYLMGLLQGDLFSFNSNKSDYTAHYQNGICGGKLIDYYADNGKIYREMSIRNDDRHGISDYYAPDGNFMYRLRFENDVIKGYSWKNSSGNFVPEVPVTLTTTQMVTYYPTGKISARISISKGNYHGKFLTYYANGTPLQVSEKFYDENTGVYKEYYPNGAIKNVTTYIADEKSGPYALYYITGKVKESGDYFSDQKNGVWTKFSETGAVQEKLIYYMDELYEIIQ